MCERIDGNSLAVEIKTACPAFNAEDCIPVSGFHRTLFWLNYW